MALRATLLFIIVAAISVDVNQARSLKDVFQGDGREAYINSRIINMRPSRGNPTSRSSITPENAESSATSQHAGAHRVYAPSARRSYATVNPNADMNNMNKAVQTRARSAQDVSTGGPNRSNGNPNKPAMVVGGLVHAQTYEGATATASTDSIPLNRGSGSAISANKVTSRQGAFRGARPQTSWGVTSQGVGSGALVGATNGLVAMAQADQAVAYSHGEQPARDRKWVEGRIGAK